MYWFNTVDNSKEAMNHNSYFNFYVIMVNFLDTYSIINNINDEWTIFMKTARTFYWPIKGKQKLLKI